MQGPLARCRCDSGPFSCAIDPNIRRDWQFLPHARAGGPSARHGLPAQRPYSWQWVCERPASVQDSAVTLIVGLLMVGLAAGCLVACLDLGSMW